MPHIARYGRNVQLDELQALWGPIYQGTLQILGTTGTIFPFGDPRQGQPDATTFKTVGAEQVTCTWSEAPASFVAGLDLTSPDSFQGIIPFIDMNRTDVDEEADTPDIGYFSRDDSGTNPMSMAAWVNITHTATFRSILSKWLNGSNLNEWRFSIDASELLLLGLNDESAGITIDRTSDDPVAIGSWINVVATYDSAGGASAANGVTLYVDGVEFDSTANNNGSYVAMENKTQVVMIGGHDGNANFVNYMAGACNGPWFTQIELTADQVAQIYLLQRGAMGV